jgi:uncharacterized membrane protein YcaP (DUF421 family)
MWFDSWADLARILAVGASAYVGLVLVLRLSGKRTLAKLNAFDLVVTVALGSTLATVLLNSSVSWVEGILAMALLAAAQFAVAWLTVRRPRLRAVVTARPTMVFRDGRPVTEALRQQRVSMDEIRQAIRASGSGDLSTVAAVVLESDGSLSVIAVDRLGDRSTLVGVDGAPQQTPMEK